MRFAFLLMLAVVFVSSSPQGMAGGSAPTPAGREARVSSGSPGSAKPMGAVGGSLPGWAAGANSGSAAGNSVRTSGNGLAPSALAFGIESPLVYRQAGYLGTIGPAPMRFGPPSPGCNERTPPRVSSTSKKAGGSSAEAAMTPSFPVPAAPNPVPALGGGGVSDLFGGASGESGGGSVREQAMSFFTTPAPVDSEVQKNRLRMLLDPIPSFQPAPPPVAAPLPPSSATFRQN
jgi:hypothetical protein